MFSPERILNLLLLRSGNGKVRVSGGGGRRGNGKGNARRRLYVFEA